MNTRGKIITRYMQEYPQKHKEYQKCRNDKVGYIHWERMNRIITLAYVLANRHKIRCRVSELYRELLSPQEIVDILVGNVDWIEPCFLDMGMEFSIKDIEKGLVPDFIVYSDLLRDELMQEVKRIFRYIDSYTIELLFCEPKYH